MNCLKQPVVFIITTKIPGFHAVIESETLYTLKTCCKKSSGIVCHDNEFENVKL